MILVVDDSPFAQKIVDTIQVTNPASKSKDFVITDGNFPFDDVRREDIEMLIVAQPRSCVSKDTIHQWAPREHAAEWIESFRFGARWHREGVGKFINIKAKTKAQLPIIYIHKHSHMDLRTYPSTFPEVYIMNNKESITKKFVAKWFKTLGANEVIFYPWLAEELSDAYTNALNFTTRTPSMDHQVNNAR
tara:strand:- start:112 stop:681 length:570 start_codon:yes stop_codon:yes gene_type:complete